MSFYLKYRPRKIEELDLTKVRETLQKILISGNVPKSMLMVGPRGGGKTSAARIVAKVVNCEKNVDKKELGEPCLECEMCRVIEDGRAVDVMEMDAASNRGIDAIRELREKINLSPVQATFKVYIIDEVHMLTTEAFNALLKTLEEPPKHALFILCTTEEHKVPETILSRCTKIAFYKASAEEIKRSLAKAVDGEKLKVEADALDYLASGVDGSFREGHKLLELLARQGGKIDLEKVKMVLGQAKGVVISELSELYLSGATEQILVKLAEAERAGVDWLNLMRLLIDDLRAKLRMKYLEGTQIDERRLVEVLKRLTQSAVEMKGSLVEQLPLEIAAVELGLANQTEKKNTIQPDEKPIVSKEVVQEGEDKIHKTMIGKAASIDEVNQKWEELLKVLAPKNHSVAGLLRATRPKAVEDRFLVLEVFYKFHKEQLEQETKRRLLEEVLSEMLGLSAVRLVMGESQPERKPMREVGVATDLVNEAENIFGS